MGCWAGAWRLREKGNQASWEGGGGLPHVEGILCHGKKTWRCSCESRTNYTRLINLAGRGKALHNLRWLMRIFFGEMPSEHSARVKTMCHNGPSKLPVSLWFPFESHLRNQHIFTRGTGQHHMTSAESAGTLLSAGASAGLEAFHTVLFGEFW